LGVTAIVLAAGASRRLGSPKQLVVVGQETLVHRAARIARAVAPTIVVIPDTAIATAIRNALADLEVTIVENPDAAEGMASSLRAGVAACDGDVLLTLCDQIEVPSSHLAALVNASAPIAATSYDGSLGVPAFFSAEFREELLALRGDRGAKTLLQRHARVVMSIALPAAAIDVDDAADVRRVTHAPSH
jgi:molybdenum cofactor cytidylyltransferase